MIWATYCYLMKLKSGFITLSRLIKIFWFNISKKLSITRHCSKVFFCKARFYQSSKYFFCLWTVLYRRFCMACFFYIKHSKASFFNILNEFFRFFWYNFINFEYNWLDEVGVILYGRFYHNVNNFSVFPWAELEKKPNIFL